MFTESIRNPNEIGDFVFHEERIDFPVMSGEKRVIPADLTVITCTSDDQLTVIIAGANQAVAAVLASKSINQIHITNQSQINALSRDVIAKLGLFVDSRVTVSGDELKRRLDFLRTKFASRNGIVHSGVNIKNYIKGVAFEPSDLETFQS